MNDGVLNSILNKEQELNDEKLDIIIKAFNEKLEQINNNFDKQLKELSEKYTQHNQQETTVNEPVPNIAEVVEQEPIKTAEQLYNELRKKLGLDNE